MAPVDRGGIGTATLISKELDDRQQRLRRLVLEPRRLAARMAALRAEATPVAAPVPACASGGRRLVDRTPPARPRAALLAEGVTPTAAARLRAAVDELLAAGWDVTVVGRSTSTPWLPDGAAAVRVPLALPLAHGAPAADVYVATDPTAIAAALPLGPTALLTGVGPAGAHDADATVAAPPPAVDVDLDVAARRRAGTTPRYLVVGDDADVDVDGQLLWATQSAPKRPQGQVFVGYDAERLAAIAATADGVVWRGAADDPDLAVIVAAGCPVVGGPGTAPTAAAGAGLDAALRPLAATAVAGHEPRPLTLPPGRFAEPWMADALLAALARTDAYVAVPLVWEAFEGHRMATWSRPASSGALRLWLPYVLDGDPPALRHRAAVDAFRAGDPGAALRTLIGLHHEATTAGEKATTARWIALALLELGRDEEAFGVAADAVEVFHDHTDLAYLLAAIAPTIGLEELAARGLEAVQAVGEAAHHDELLLFDDVEPAAAIAAATATSSRGATPDVVPVTILTPAIPERLDLLADCLASIAAQTTKPVEHLVVVDTNHAGPAPTFDRLLRMATTEWVAFMADDDLADPRHLEVLWAAVDADPTLDVVYTWCRTDGKYGFDLYNQPFDGDRLATESIVAGTALFRRELGLAVGGFVAEFGEDWRFWQRLHAAGARFLAVPEITWTYRFHGQNHSKGDLG